MTTILDRFFGVLIGMEFRKETVIVSLLKNGMSGISLLSSASFPFKDDEVTVSDIKEYIGRHAPNAGRAFVSIPDRWATIKFIEIPSTKGKGKEALPNLMKYEIERHIPFAPDTVLYDFQVVEDALSTYKVAFVAVQKKRVERIKDFLARILLEPHSITISSLSLLNTVELSGAGIGGWQSIVGIMPGHSVTGSKGETNISLFLDDAGVSVSIIKGGYCLSIRSFAYDAEDVSVSLSAVISSYLADMKGELDLQKYDKLIISGDVSAAPELAAELTSATGASAVVVEQLPRFAERPETVDEGIHASVGACLGELGIGRYRINILPHKPDYEIKRVTYMGTKVFAGLVVLLLILIVSVQSIKHKDTLKRIDEELQMNKFKITEYTKLAAEFEGYKRQGDLLQSIKGNELALEVLAELSGILPGDTWISNFQYKGAGLKNGDPSTGEIILGGYSDSSSKLISILEGSEYFERVSFVGSIKKARDKEGFKIQASIITPAGSEE